MRQRIFLTLFWVFYIGASILILLVLPWISDSMWFVISTQVVYFTGMAIYGAKIIEYATNLKIVKAEKPVDKYFIVVFYQNRMKPVRKMHFKDLNKAMESARDIYFNGDQVKTVKVYEYVPAIPEHLGAQIVQEYPQKEW